MARPRWAQDAGTFTVDVPCGEATHRVHWQRGDVALLDHDLQGERALVALGGEVPMCLLVHDFLTGRLGTAAGTGAQIVADPLARRATRVTALSVASKPGTSASSAFSR